MSVRRHLTIHRPAVELAVTDCGGSGPPLILLHGLAGSSRELLPTADALTDLFHVLILDQRGHGRSTRRPADVSRRAFVDDLIAVIEQLFPGEACSLIGQSMGAHTAFLAAVARPDLIERLVMLEGHVAGTSDPEEVLGLRDFFESWPVPFTDEQAARDFLGAGALVDAWIADLEKTPHGLFPRFHADVMERTIKAVHEPRWAEWQALQVSTLAVFAKNGMFNADDKRELIRCRPATARIDLSAGSHDAHLDAFEEWIGALRGWLTADMQPG